MGLGPGRREEARMSEPSEIMRGTGQGLVEFFDRAAGRGELNKSTALATRTTARKVLAVESEDLSSVDVRRLDVDDVLDRFVRLNKAAYSDGSIETYRTRFRLGVAMYLAWLDNDADWKSAGRTAAPAKRSARQPAGNGRAGSRTPRERPDRTAEPGTPEPPPSEAAYANASAGRVMTYDVPLRPDLVVRLTLPIDLTATDAKRLSNFINALAFSGTFVPESPSDETGGG
jgi:hypothetical protein